MKTRNVMTRIAAALLAAGTFSGAQAAESGQWMLSGGLTWLSPNVDSGTLTAPSPPGTTVDVDDDLQPTAAVTRFFGDHWAVEVPLGLGFEHTISGTGAIAGVGDIAKVKVLPATVFLQYRFGAPEARVRPYAMLGATYAYFYDEQGSATLDALNPVNPPRGTDLDVKSKFAATPGVGVSVRVNENWFVEAQYAHSFLSTTTTLSSGQRIRTDLDPDMVKIGVGLRF